MALGTNNNTNKIFLNVIKGKICQRVSKDTDGAVSRKNKKDEIVYELQHGFVIGKIVDITTKESDYGSGSVPNWEITLDDVGEKYILNLPISGRVTNGILFRLPNINLKEEVKIITFLDKEKEDRTVLIVQQNGKTVPVAYKKDAPNGLPQLEKVMFKGKEEWDDTKQQLFIKNMIETTIKPQLNAINQPATPPAPVVQPQDDDDQLPF